MMDVEKVNQDVHSLLLSCWADHQSSLSLPSNLKSENSGSRCDISLTYSCIRYQLVGVLTSSDLKPTKTGIARLIIIVLSCFLFFFLFLAMSENLSPFHSPSYESFPLSIFIYIIKANNFFIFSFFEFFIRIFSYLFWLQYQNTHLKIEYPVYSIIFNFSLVIY